MKGLRLYFILSFVGLALYLTAQYYEPKPTNWKPTYLKEDKIPFGLYLLHQQIRDLFPHTSIEIARKPVSDILNEKTFDKTAYLLVASTVDMDSLDYRKLKQFMERGNNVFIAAFNLSEFLRDTLNLDLRAYDNKNDGKGIPINFSSPSLRLKSSYRFDKGLGNQYFYKLDTTRAVVLGKNAGGRANFVKYTFGKGALYILPNPQLLCNYSLINPAGADYAAKALSYLQEVNTLIWDEYNTVGDEDAQSPLSVIFKYDSIRWAYYLALSGLIIFVFFEMKRRQRIIPIIEAPKNSSVEFVEVVGKVYYQQRDNRDIADKKIAYVLEYIRNNYRLKTTVLDEELQHALSVRSGIPEETLARLLKCMKDLQNSAIVSDHQLIELNKLIEQFYKKVQ